MANRKLSSAFMDDLMRNSGIGLNNLLKAVKQDATLCLEIRNNYINVYYRGGSLIKLSEIGNGQYTAEFNVKYFNNSNGQQSTAAVSVALPTGGTLLLPQVLCNGNDVDKWIHAIPWLKYEMDIWLGDHPKNEREFQQVVVKENNFGGSAKGTDYFICDIEYDNQKGARFDLVAAHWPSTSSARKNNEGVRLAIIEMKYMDSALTGSSGIIDHIDKAKAYLGNSSNLQSLRDEMVEVFKQKRELGLINNQKDIKSFLDEKPEFIFLFANHDPESSTLSAELDKLNELLKKDFAELPFEIKIATSNFMGYGLYDQAIYDFQAFKEAYEERIYLHNPGR